MKNQREVAIVGVGLHPWGKFEEKFMEEMGTGAIINALAGARMDCRQIEAMTCASGQSILREAYFAAASGEYDVVIAVGS